MELRSPPTGAPAPLESVLCTYALNRRQSRPPDYQSENRVLADLASALAESPRTVLRKLVEAALELCQAGSAGISLLSQVDDGRTFHWPAVAGAWKRQAGREALREALPCGLVLDRNAPQLFAQPALHYRDLSGIKPPIEEALVTPFYVNRRVVGTIWVFTHDPARKLDPEDMRILGTLGKFAADAYHLLESVGALHDQGALRRERSAPRPAAAAEAPKRGGRAEGTQQEESELQKYRSLFNSIDEGFCIAEVLYDPAGKPVDCKIRDINAAFKRHSPLKVGDTVRDVLPEPEQSLFDMYGQVVATGEPIRIERYNPRLSRWFDVHVSRMGGENSRELAIVFTDITARKQTEEEIRRNQESLYNLVERAPFGVYIVDSSFRIAQINADSQERAFRNVKPAVGRDFAEAIRILWPEPIATEVIGHFRRTLETGEPYFSKDYIHPRADIEGVEAYEWELHRMMLPDGEYGVVCYYYDSTKLREAEQAHAQARELLSEADRRKDEFLAMLAHELRNPLAAIRNAAQILRVKGGEDATLHSASEMLDRQVGQMVRLVDDLLDVSRITRGKIELRKERVELASVVNHAVEAVRPLFESKGNELTVTMPLQKIHLDADPTRLSQVVGNLLNNACKFTKPGGRVKLAVEVVKGGESSGGEAVIRVTDNGAGIAADQLEHIFDLFVQADTSLEREHSGLGIGLTLVKNLVEMHDGKVVAQSQGIGDGSEFEVRLPVVIGMTQVPAESPGAGAAAAAVHRRILIVDDNRDSADSLAMLLKLSGHEVHAAFDGLEALAAAADLRPDVILVDLGLPKLNGYEVARRIRETQGAKPVLVALTGLGQAEDRRRSEEAGFNVHMVKPVDLATLQKLLAASGST
jgi:signal transduction histidine kinase/CheY-like chemotaxis protein